MTAQPPDVPTRLGTPLQPVDIYEVANGEPASQTRVLPQTNPRGSTATFTVVAKPFARVSVAAAHIVGSGRRWQIEIAPATPSLALTAAYGKGRHFVAEVGGMAAGMLYVLDERGTQLGYGLIMGDHLQVAQTSARTWTTQVTTTTRGSQPGQHG